MLQGLPFVVVGRNGYTDVHRAQDFIAVFSGHSSPEQGQRVYAQIADICQGMAWPTDADKPGTLAFKAGARWVLTTIMSHMQIREAVTIERDMPDG